VCRGSGEPVCSNNESLVWIWISGVVNAILLMCVYLVLVLSKEHAELEGSGCCVVSLFLVSELVDHVTVVGYN
jgi:hypothetical protein